MDSSEQSKLLANLSDGPDVHGFAQMLSPEGCGALDTRQMAPGSAEPVQPEDSAELLSSGQTSPTSAINDRRASWQKLPNVTVAPRHRRKLAAAAAEGIAFDTHAMEHLNSDTTQPHGGEDDTMSNDENSNRASSSSPDTAVIIASLARPTNGTDAHFSDQEPHPSPSSASVICNSVHSNGLSGKAISPKLRRKLASTISAASTMRYSPPATPADAPPSVDETQPEVVVFSVQTVNEPLQVELSPPAEVPEVNVGGKRRRQVPDSMQSIACYFCRRRKIKCGPPEGDVKSCPPCAKRQLPCEYAEKSNRGMRTDLIRKKIATQSTITAEDEAAAHVLIEVAERAAQVMSFVAAPSTLTAS